MIPPRSVHLHRSIRARQDLRGRGAKVNNMRISSKVLFVAVIAGLLLGPTASSAEPGEFEGTVMIGTARQLGGAPNPSVTEEEFVLGGCTAEPADSQGVDAWVLDMEAATTIDLEATPLATVPAAGPLEAADLPDFDLYVYDDTCTLINESATAGSSERIEMKPDDPAKWAVIVLWTGANAPFKLTWS